MSAKPKKNSGNRQAQIFLIDYAFFLSMTASAVTGVFLWLFIGKGSGEDKFLWGWHRHDWGNLHLYFSLACLFLLFVHFIQHWRWIRAVTPKQAGPSRGARGIGLLLLVTLATFAVVFACFYVFRDDTGAYGQGKGRQRHAAWGNFETNQAEVLTKAPSRGGGRQWRGGRNARAEALPEGFVLTPSASTGNLNTVASDLPPANVKETGNENLQGNSAEPRRRGWGRGRRHGWLVE